MKVSTAFLFDRATERMSTIQNRLATTQAQMAAAFADWPEALANTVAIAERCNVGIEFGVYHLPVFQPEDGTAPDAFFERICTEGAIRRYGAIDATIRERLDYEIGVIKKLGFVSYFLIVQDFIQKAKTMGKGKAKRAARQQREASRNKARRGRGVRRQVKSHQPRFPQIQRRPAPMRGRLWWS